MVLERGRGGSLFGQQSVVANVVYPNVLGRIDPGVVVIIDDGIEIVSFAKSGLKTWRAVNTCILAFLGVRLIVDIFNLGSHPPYHSRFYRSFL
jgi:hypothetical protein